MIKITHQLCLWRRPILDFTRSLSKEPTAMVSAKSQQQISAYCSPVFSLICCKLRFASDYKYFAYMHTALDCVVVVATAPFTLKDQTIFMRFRTTRGSRLNVTLQSLVDDINKPKMSNFQKVCVFTAFLLISVDGAALIGLNYTGNGTENATDYVNQPACDKVCWLISFQWFCFSYEFSIKYKYNRIDSRLHFNFFMYVICPLKFVHVLRLLDLHKLPN